MTAQFLTPLRMEYIGGRRPYRLLEPLRYATARWDGVWIVPEGFITDLASVPRLVWNIFPRDGAYIKAAVIHDASYSGDLRTDSGQRVRLIKPFADYLLWEAARADGVGAVTAWCFHRMVSSFGTKSQTLTIVKK